MWLAAPVTTIDGTRPPPSPVGLPQHPVDEEYPRLGDDCPLDSFSSQVITMAEFEVHDLEDMIVVTSCLT